VAFLLGLLLLIRLLYKATIKLEAVVVIFIILLPR
jgi:hypothetical protein